MNELQRQAYIRALGAAPWVAQRPLPGAAPSQQLAETLPEPSLDTLPTEISGASSDEGASVSALTSEMMNLSALLKSDSASNKQQDTSHEGSTDSAVPMGSQKGASRDEDVSEAQAQVSAEAEPLTLQLISIGNLVLAAEQSDPQAPALGRDAQQLLNNMLKIFSGRPQSLNPFTWPMLDEDDEHLAVSFQHFIQHLSGNKNMLMLLSEAAASRLGAMPRFTAQQWGDTRVLAVHSLDEMLAAPLEAKPTTWQAMLKEGFASSVPKPADK